MTPPGLELHYSLITPAFCGARRSRTYVLLARFRDDTVKKRKGSRLASPFVSASIISKSVLGGGFVMMRCRLCCCVSDDDDHARTPDWRAVPGADSNYSVAPLA